MSTTLSQMHRGDPLERTFALEDGFEAEDFDELWFTVRLRPPPSSTTDDESALAQVTLTGGGIAGALVTALSKLPPDVITALGRVVARVVAGDKRGAAVEAEKAATLQAGKRAFAAAARRGRAARK